MNTQKIKKYTMIGVAALAAGLFSIGVNAAGGSAMPDEPQLIYQSSFGHHSIYTYPSSVPSFFSLKPEIIYVSQAYGPAIHSYPHAAADITAPWNIEYVDTAYGPAIYSYERRHADSDVKVLPIVTE